MKITITEDDIKYGLKASCRSCPVAKAVKRALKKDKVLVGSDSVCLDVSNFDLHRDVLLPQEAIDFIKKFDSYVPGYDADLEPFEFELNYE